MTAEQKSDVVTETRSELQAWRVRVLNILLITVSIAAAPAIANAVLQAIQSPEGGLETIPFLGIYLFVVGLTLLQRLDFRVRAWGLLAVGYAIGILFLGLLGLLGNGMLFLLAMPVLGLLLVGARSGLVMAGFSLLLHAVFSLAAYVGWMDDWLIIRENSLELSQWLSQGLSFALLLVVLVVIQSLLSRAQSQALQQAGETMGELRTARDQLQVRTEELARHTRLLQAAARVSREMASLLDREQLLERAVGLMAERLGFDRVAVYLADKSERQTELGAVAGPSVPAESGREIPAAVTQVIGNGTSEAVLWAGDEMVLPLRVGGQIIGALDLHAGELAQYGDQEVGALQTMADQLAVAIQNAQLLAETQTSLRELDALYRHYTAEAWQEFAGEQPEAMRHRLGSEEMSDETWQRLFEQARTSRAAVTELDERGSARHLLAVPVKLRNLPIGVLGFHRSASAGPWQPTEIASIETVVERLALSIENVRLLEQAQRRAAHDRMVAEITARTRASLDPDTILKTAVRELGRAVGAEWVSVAITGPEGDDGNSLGEGAVRAKEA
jgi:GAF domain-containing protein